MWTTAAARVFELLWALLSAVVLVLPAERPPSLALPWDGVRDRIALVSGVEVSELTHELDHICDRRDDGVFNGSCGPSLPAAQPAWMRTAPMDDTMRAHCMRRVEYPACVAQFAPEQWLAWWYAREGGE